MSRERGRRMGEQSFVLALGVFFFWVFGISVVGIFWTYNTPFFFFFFFFFYTSTRSTRSRGWHDSFIWPCALFTDWTLGIGDLFLECRSVSGLA